MDNISDIHRNGTYFYEKNPQYINKTSTSEEILTDGKSNWQDLKLRSTAASQGFDITDETMFKRSARVFNCADTLEFETDKNTGVRKLKHVWFCKDRMCPMCQKRRSLVVFHQVRNVCTAISRDNPDYKYALLTLTVPNVAVEDLPEKITEMTKAWGRLIKRKEFTNATVGWFRTLEVTYNAKREDFHPHYHVLICVPKSYFGRNYIKQSRWLELWQEAMRDPSITQVDIRVIKPNSKKQGSDAISSAAAEVGKYATKPSDYLIKAPGTKDRYLVQKQVFQDLTVGLGKRKLVAFGGLMLEYSKGLGQKDVDSDHVDLIHVDGESEQIEAVVHQLYRWNIGLNNYTLQGES